MNYRHITLARRRGKEGEPGELETLVSPDKPIQDHVSAYETVCGSVGPLNTSEEFAEVVICQLSERYKHRSFKTAAEAKSDEDAAKKFAKAQSKTTDDSAARQQKLDEAEAERKAAEQKRIVEAMNKQHDAVRQTRVTA